MVLIMKQKGKKEMFPSNVTHTHALHAQPPFEKYVISTFEMLYLKYIIFKTETQKIFQKESKKRQSWQCSVDTVQVMGACSSACDMVSLSVLHV